MVLVIISICINLIIPDWDQLRPNVFNPLFVVHLETIKLTWIGIKIALLGYDLKRQLFRLGFVN